jgi:hypothetical protein
MKKRVFGSLLAAFLFCLSSLGADETKLVIQIIPFTIDGLGAEEARIIQSLIQSYAAAMGEVVGPAVTGLTGNKVETSAGGETDDSLDAFDNPPPDYVISGSITLEQDNRLLALEIFKTGVNEGVLYSSSHKTTGELVLKVRSLVEVAFSGGADNFREAEPEPLSTSRIAGTWRGDTGIELVRLQQDGRGIAIFSSGAQMNLAYSIENNTLMVSQNSPNTERYYHPVPYGVARELTVNAEPMRWEFLLYENGTSLRGIKVATAVRYEGDRVLELLPGSARDAEWTRVGR